MNRILVVGSANMDLIMSVSRLPRPGETLLGGEFLTAHGGKGANQAVAAARLGGRVCFMGCVGEDGFGELQQKGLAREGIALDHLKIHPEWPTGTAMILLTATGENTIVVAPGANNGLVPEDVALSQDAFREADVLVSQLEIPLEVVETALCEAKKNHVFSILDTGPARSEAVALLHKADLVTPNESEAEALTGIRVDSIDAARAAAKCIQDKGVEHVVMKLGEQGCLYLGAQELYVPPFKVNAIDTTGAGDAFTAALGVAWGEVPVKEALYFANAAGALATTVLGAQPSMPTLAEIFAFLDVQSCPYRFEKLNNLHN